MTSIKNIERIYETWYHHPDTSDFAVIQQRWRSLVARYKAANISSAYTPHQQDEILDVGGGSGEVSKALVDFYGFPTIS